MNADQEFDRIVQESTSAILPHLHRCMENFHRVGRLAGAAGDDEDILRAAVVLLHAPMEDCLRSIFKVYLPQSGKEQLDAVPLVGSPSRSAQKFLLGSLTNHRHQTVAEVIEASVHEHANQITFGSANAIISKLSALPFLAPPNDRLPEIERMILRRHQIVHCADRDDSGALCPIHVNEVLEWAGTVIHFLSQILCQVGVKEAFDRCEDLIVRIARERGITL